MLSGLIKALCQALRISSHPEERSLTGRMAFKSSQCSKEYISWQKEYEQKAAEGRLGMREELNMLSPKE